MARMHITVPPCTYEALATLAIGAGQSVGEYASARLAVIVEQEEVERLARQSYCDLCREWHD